MSDLPRSESLLKNGVTRDMEVLQHEKGWYYTISEGGIRVHTSDLYKTSSICASAGVKMLDAMHEIAPIRNDYLPGE